MISKKLVPFSLVFIFVLASKLDPKVCVLSLLTLFEDAVEEYRDMRMRNLIRNFGAKIFGNVVQKQVKGLKRSRCISKILCWMALNHMHREQKCLGLTSTSTP